VKDRYCRDDNHQKNNELAGLFDRKISVGLFANTHPLSLLMRIMLRLLHDAFISVLILAKAILLFDLHQKFVPICMKENGYEPIVQAHRSL